MSHKPKQNFNAGDLVVLRVFNKNLTSDGLGTVGTCADEKRAKIYEKIRTSSYPSSNDFFGRSSVIKEGTRAMVLKKIGRPDRIISSKEWCQYDIYEILLNGYTFQVFSYNLEHANE